MDHTEWGSRTGRGRDPLPQALIRRFPVFLFCLLLVFRPLRPFMLRSDNDTWALLSFVPGTPEVAELWPKEGGKA